MTDEAAVDNSIPEFVQEPYIEEHKDAVLPQQAHPIDADIVKTVCETKAGSAIIDFDLAMIQAVATRAIQEFNDEAKIRLLHDEGNVRYAQTTSPVFGELVSRAQDRYDDVIKVEDMPDIVEAHTRQYLRDVHGYEGDFGGQVRNDSIDMIPHPTICNAQNDGDLKYPRSSKTESSQNDDHSIRDEERQGAHYAFFDSRGLVIEEGTHE